MMLLVEDKAWELEDAGNKEAADNLRDGADWIYNWYRVALGREQ